MSQTHAMQHTACCASYGQIGPTQDMIPRQDNGTQSFVTEASLFRLCRPAVWTPCWAGARRSSCWRVSLGSREINLMCAGICIAEAASAMEVPLQAALSTEGGRFARHVAAIFDFSQLLSDVCTNAGYDPLHHRWLAPCSPKSCVSLCGAMEVCIMICYWVIWSWLRTHLCTFASHHQLWTVQDSEC